MKKLEKKLDMEQLLKYLRLTLEMYQIDINAGDEKKIKDVKKMVLGVIKNIESSIKLSKEQKKIIDSLKTRVSEQNKNTNYIDLFDLFEKTL